MTRTPEQDRWGRKTIHPPTVTRKQREALREQEDQARIVQFHRDQRDRVLNQPQWDLPDPPDKAA